MIELAREKERMLYKVLSCGQRKLSATPSFNSQAAAQFRTSIFAGSDPCAGISRNRDLRFRITDITPTPCDMDTLTPQAMHKLVFTILVHGLPDSQTGIALDILGNALKSPNGQVRELAVVALSELVVSPSKRVALLREALRDPYARVRRRAARALGDFGPHAHVVVPQIASGLRDPDPSVRRDSAGTLGRLGSAAAMAVPGLIALLGDQETRTRVVAATALKRIGRDAVNGLIQGLEHVNAELRGRCVTLLGQLAPDDVRVNAALKVVSADSNAEVRLLAGQALTRTPVPVATPLPEEAEEFAVAVG